MEAKKSLGQNFFINKNLGKYISTLIEQLDCESVIEIGPGKGFFTELLIDNFKDITVIEKDAELAKELKIQYPNIAIINDDFLDIDLDSLVTKDCCFFGSLPFNVSKPIIRKIIQSKSFKKQSLFIVQKEVAEKYLYNPPYSVLSLTTAIYAKCKKILDISPDSFRPKPNVTSSLISFSPIERGLPNTKLLEQLIQASFQKPRKNLKNNLKGSIFEQAGKDFFELRPAQISLEEYIKIYEYFL